jgi:hypothetical protein
MNTNTARTEPSVTRDPETACAATVQAVSDYLRRTTVLPAQCVRPARFGAIARILGRSVSGLDAASLEVITDVFLFIFAVDDLVDEGGLAYDEIALRLGQYKLCAELVYCPEVAFDPIAACLVSISRRLRAATLGDALWTEWVRRVHDLLDAMLDEQSAADQLRAEGVTPTLDEYLESGRHSVGIALMSMTAWVVFGESAVVLRLARLVAAERRLSLACRLANDLRTHARELAEGTLNALTIVGVAGAPTLRRRIAHELDAGRAMLGDEPASVARSARFLEGFAAAVVALYATRDFHTPEMSALKSGTFAAVAGR